MRNFFFILVFISTIVNLLQAKVVPDVRCNRRFLTVRVNKTEEVRRVELEKWDSIPGCQFSSAAEDSFSIKLKLTSDLPCGITKIRNKLTDDSFYYHKIAITNEEGQRQLFKVSCFFSRSGHGVRSNIVKRNVLPPEFVEPDYIEITSEVTGSAPIPELSVGVRQNGNLINNQITVSPGAPLSMEVYLDSESASTYGILVSYMMVTDTNSKNETIIYNGCTQDHYVFGNFETNDGDFLTAKFRAFKFPESNYLLFRGTVDVCLDTCQGIRCSNSEIGYGKRRKRSIHHNNDANKIFEVSMVTIIKVESQDIGGEAAISKDISGSRKLHSINNGAEEGRQSLLLTKSSPEEASSNTPPYTFFHRNGSTSSTSLLAPILLSLFILLHIIK